MTSGGIAVVICCRDRAALLEQALVSVLDALEPHDELVVVDSASRDPEVRRVAERAGAVVLTCELPGLSRARNAGWRATSHEVVVFTDDDCRPLPGWRVSALQAFEDPGVGAVWGSVTADRDSEVPLSSGETELRELDRDSVLSAVGHGASMAFRRVALESLGGFDEWLGAGSRFPAGEDKDAFWRAYAAGWRVVPAPGVAVTHVVHRETSEAARVMRSYGIGAGAVARKRAPEIGVRRLLNEELWLHGALPGLRHLRHGQWVGARVALLRMRGVGRGWWGASRMAVVDGHLAPRR